MIDLRFIFLLITGTTFTLGYGLTYLAQPWIGFVTLGVLILIGSWLLGNIIFKEFKTLEALNQSIEKGHYSIKIPKSYFIRRIFEQLQRICQTSLEMKRLKIGIDTTSSSIMIADDQCTIRYCNDSMVRAFSMVENDLRKDLPHFSARHLVGQNIDSFHKNPQHQRGMVENLRQTYCCNIKVGGCTFDLIANPIVDEHNNRLGTIVEWKNITSDLKVKTALEDEISKLIDCVNKGDLTYRVETENKEGFMKSLAIGMNQLSEIIQNVLTSVDKYLKALTEGNLDQRIEDNFSGMFDTIKQNANTAAEKLKSIIFAIMESIHNVGSTSKEIASGIGDLDHRTQKQASNLEETAASMEQLTTTVKCNEINAQEALQISETTAQAARQGEQVVKKVVDAMQQIQDSSIKISEIIGLIDEIAFQTNLLSLNASVESARAGEHGKGFGVVAQEVRALAENCAQASRQIKSLIKTSRIQVKDGFGLAHQAAQALDNIMGSVNKVSDMTQQISLASSEQTMGLNQINMVVSQLDEMTQKNAALVTQSVAAARSLDEEVEDLMKRISFFKI